MKDMNYTVFYKKRKSICLHIIDENNIKILAPLNTPKNVIEDFIKSKNQWINGKTALIKLQKNKFADILSGKKISIFGELIDANDNKVDLYRKEAEAYIENRTKELSIKFGFKYASLKFKNYKSKWGQCNINGYITLNKKLIMLNKDIIDYVILHELCHTVYMNHKKNFHLLLKKYFPNEKDIIKRLKEYSILIRTK